jgi:hypothetical protein
MLAGVAAGVFDGPAQAQAALGARTRRFEPSEATEAYEEIYWRYREKLRATLNR